METKTIEPKVASTPLKEDHSVKQSPNKQLIADIFNKQPEFKHRYARKTRNILRDVHPKNYKSGKDLPEGDYPGIYGLECEGRSIINKLDTNYSACAILYDEINLVIIKKGKQIINFKDKFGKELMEEADRFFHIMEKYKHKIYSKDSPIMQKLFKMVTETSWWGDKREDIVIKKLKWGFGNENVIKVAKLGGEDDMFNGIDVIVKRKEQEYTGQIKPFKNIEKSGDNYIMHDTGNVKNYKTSWLIFENRTQGIYIFDNQDVKIVDGKYVIPSINLIIHLKE